MLRLHLATGSARDLGTRLIERFGSAARVFEQAPAELAAAAGLRPRALARLRSAGPARLAETELRRCEREGIRLLIRSTGVYPVALRDLPQMPLVLFSLGRLDEGDGRAVGIVGTRRPSPYGLRQARRFAARLAGWEVTVVSGLARGIDGTAQEAALAVGGRTVAVLGSGLGRIYPPEHRGLAERIVSRDLGAVVSEFPFDTPPRSYHFPQRNRVLSGLSLTLLVVEAGERSGSLITVDWALRQGRSVHVLPGRVDQPQAIGALKLLRDGAIPAIEPEDLRPELGLDLLPEGKAGTERARRSALPGPLGARLVALFEEEDAWPADQLAERLGQEASGLMAELTRLELGGHLERAPDGAYVLGGGTS